MVTSSTLSVWLLVLPTLPPPRMSTETTSVFVPPITLPTKPHVPVMGTGLMMFVLLLVPSTLPLERTWLDKISVSVPMVITQLMDNVSVVISIPNVDLVLDHALPIPLMMLPPINVFVP